VGEREGEGEGEDEGEDEGEWIYVERLNVDGGKEDGRQETGDEEDRERKEGAKEDGQQEEGLIQAAVRLYRSFPGYAEGEGEYGVCAIEVEVMRHW